MKDLNIFRVSEIALEKIEDLEKYKVVKTESLDEIILERFYENGALEHTDENSKFHELDLFETLDDLQISLFLSNEVISLICEDMSNNGMIDLKRRG